MSLIKAAVSQGTVSTGNGLYKSAMSLIIAAKSIGNPGLENLKAYRLAMSLITAAGSDGNAMLRKAYLDHLCHSI